ncbi:IS607 family transposase, partial [Ligilactobacillus hayakitensis]|uniref:IS607 family transposase n=1 Tax=Ligilactobacillus hayakitensis TaxID=396716 RepID=UPI00046978D6
GVTVRTLQIWDKKGTLKAYRTPTNRRYYTEEQYLEYIGQSSSDKRKNVAYARVSTNGQKDDLKNQIDFIRQYVNAKGVILDEAISDIGSGLNYNRKKWNKLLEEVMENQIDTIYITYKDRFIRFGYEWFERLCNMHNTKIVVLNNVNTSPTQEMVDDMISIIHVFSCRLYGLRKYKNKLKNDESLKGGNVDGSANAKS